MAAELGRTLSEQFLWAFRVVFYVPLPVLKRAGVNLDPFHRWQEVSLRMMASWRVSPLMQETVDRELSDELHETCFDEMRVWPFYNGIAAPMMWFDLSHHCDRLGDDLTIETVVLGTADLADSRAMVEKIRSDTQIEGCRMFATECRVPLSWIRPDSIWTEAPETGYELMGDGGWNLSADSSELFRDTEGNPIDIDDDE